MLFRSVILETNDIISGTFADDRISESSVTQHVGALDHQSLNGSGTNTHTQIDMHIADDTLHSIINDSDTSSTELWSSNKINTELSISNNEIQQVSSESESSTTSSIFQQKLRMNTNSLVNGTYKITWYCEIRSSSKVITDVQVELNDTTILGQLKIEPDRNSHSIPFSGFSFQTLSGVNTIDIDWRMPGNGTSYIKRARLSLKRINLL